jgi:hypothetical protein
MPRTAAQTTRIVIFSIVSLFSLIMCVVGAWRASRIAYLYFVGQYAALALATGILNLACIGTVSVSCLSPYCINTEKHTRYLVDYKRKGSFISYLCFELAWVGVLWIMNLATGSFTSNYVVYDCIGPSNVFGGPLSAT